MVNNSYMNSKGFIEKFKVDYELEIEKRSHDPVQLSEFLLFVGPFIGRLDEIENDPVVKKVHYTVNLNSDSGKIGCNMDEDFSIEMYSLFNSFYNFIGRENDNPFYKMAHKVADNHNSQSPSELCPDCQTSLSQDRRSFLVCENCGFVEENKHCSIPSAKGFNELKFFNFPTQKFIYKKSTHFTQKVNHLLSKGAEQNIPKEVLDLIKQELRKQQIVDYTSLTTRQIRNILKRLKLIKYYEQVYGIYRLLNGIPLVTLDNDTLAQMYMTFDLVLGSFEKLKGKRNNFFSYNFIIFKILQLLGKHEFLPHIDLLKSNEKLKNLDSLWKLVCNDLNINFIATI